MKQICTQIATVLLLIIAQNVYGQNNLNISTSFPTPGPTPGFGSADSVNAANGFTSNSTGTFNNFPKNKTTTIVSPAYYYPSLQSTIYCAYNFAVATSGSTNTIPQVSIITSNGDTLTATASTTTTFSGVAGLNYYFTVTLATPLPANTNFKISLTMSVANSDKTVAGYTLSTNALRGTAAAPLPVKFAGFYAKNSNGYTSLTWNVATESNVTGYEVQRSIDGSKFSKIGFVSATNSSSYSFIDSKAGDVVYYRIKSIDVDGKYGYSIIVNVKGLQSDVVMKAFPMPVQSELTVQHNIASDNSKIEIISADGRVIKAIALTAGVQQTNVDLSSAKAGVYVVRFVNGINIQTSKIIKQ